MYTYLQSKGIRPSFITCFVFKDLILYIYIIHAYVHNQYFHMYIKENLNIQNIDITNIVFGDEG